MRAALIGKPLGHSYSREIHERLGYPYDLKEVDEGDLSALLSSGVYDGFNVTIPYKKTVMPLLDSVDGIAKKIGAVNTVKVRNRQLFGYNTDAYGLEYLMKKEGISLNDKTVMILGTGGTSLTAGAVAERLGAKEIVTVGRSSPVNYESCYNVKGVSVIINTTPVGMYPNVEAPLVQLSRFEGLESVVDVIYNPLRTRLLIEARGLGLKTAGGLKMLVAQAVRSAEIFTDTVLGDGCIEGLYRQIALEKCNVVLIGMPGAGKSTLGRLLAEELKKPFTDVDSVAEELAGKPVQRIIEEDGERAFREIESNALHLALKKGGVIATGGGCVLSKKNRQAILSNSIIAHIERDADKLSVEGRPLSSSTSALEMLQAERMPIYCDLADFSIKNNGGILSALSALKEKLL